MVEHDADADLRGRIDVDGKNARALALQVECEVAPPALPQLMGEAMRHQSVESLEVEERLDVAAAGGIAVVDGREIGAGGATELGAGGGDPPERLGGEGPGHVGGVE